MYWIPYGVVEKLKEAGFEITKSETSGRNLFHINLGTKYTSRSCPITDKGFIIGHHDRFINTGFGQHFNFGEDFLPIKFLITDKECTATNNQGQIVYPPNMEAVRKLEVLFRAYYPSRHAVIIDDQRAKILEEKKRQALEKLSLARAECERKLKELDKEMERVNEQSK